MIKPYENLTYKGEIYRLVRDNELILAGDIYLVQNEISCIELARSGIGLTPVESNRHSFDNAEELFPGTLYYYTARKEPVIFNMPILTPEVLKRLDSK